MSNIILDLVVIATGAKLIFIFGIVHTIMTDKKNK